MIIISQDKKTAYNLNELLCISRDKKRITATVPAFLEDRMPRIRLAEYYVEEAAKQEFDRLLMAIQDGKAVYFLSRDLIIEQKKSGGTTHGRTDKT